MLGVEVAVLTEGLMLALVALEVAVPGVVLMVVPLLLLALQTPEEVEVGTPSLQAQQAAQVLSLLAIPQTLGLLPLAERLRRVVETPFTHLRLLVRS